jgi:DNA-binding NarL/FixJ family response regulator
MVPSADTTRVAIAGGHPAVRGVVRLACEGAPDLEVAGEVDDAGLAAELCDRAAPDVLVMDLDGAMDGLSALRAIHTGPTRARVLVLTGRADGATILEILRLGVSGCLDKADGLRRVGESIRRVAAGDRVVAPELEQAAVMELGVFARRAREGSAIEATLTPREQQILAMISEGFTMHQVGTRLGISPRTVETHVAKLYRKLGVRTRVQAVAKAAQLGLLDLS